MFDPEFFPTPRPVFERMEADCAGKVVCDLSAGAGNLLDYALEYGAQSTIAVERNAALRSILNNKGHKVLGNDCFEVKQEQISHVNMILINPPFSNADKHIMHAWDIAPEGCEIIALCNWETVNNTYSRSREALRAIIKNYGDKPANLGNCFSEADRATDVEIGLVRLFKPISSDSASFEGFYYDVDDQGQGNGIMQYNEIRAIVNSYVAAVNCFDRFRDIATEMNNYTSAIGFGGGFSFNVGYEKNVVTKEDFAKEMQRACWKYVFDKMNLQKFVTKGVMADINKFIESRQNYPFTMRNVYRMIEIIIGTRHHTMNKAIEEAVDNFTKHTHENRWSVEGWKTNSGHMLNRKFITGWISEQKWGSSNLSIRWHQSNFEHLMDLTKALCLITGKPFDDIPDIRRSSVELDEFGEPIMIYKYHRADKTDPSYIHPSDMIMKGWDSFEAGKWYEWGFFKFKVFKKGSGHFMFKSEDDWYALNMAYAKMKGESLPERMAA